VSDFQPDLEAALGDLAEARAALVSAVQPLSGDELERSRRGGWPVRKILDHVVRSESRYAIVVSHLRGQPVPEIPLPDGEITDAEDALCRLDTTRRALLAALEGVSEDDFYTLRQVAHEEYSILSILENAAHHDQEHAAQIRATLSA
jgi:hypothetical protein